MTLNQLPHIKKTNFIERKINSFLEKLKKLKSMQTINGIELGKT